MRCTSCSTDSPADFQFCPACGIPSDPAAGAPLSPAQEAWEAMISAQLATAAYLRALFLLVVGVILTMIVIGVAANTQQQDFTSCLLDGSDCTSATPGLILIVGGVIAVAVVILALVTVSRGDRHKALAGG